MRVRKARDRTAGSFRWRAWLILGLLLIAGAGLLAQAAHLQLYRHDFYASEGNERFSRVATITAHRGMITDRNGEPLAISTPVDSVWVNPQELAPVSDQIPRLAQALKLDRQQLTQRITSNEDREFLYVARHLPPADAENRSLILFDQGDEVALEAGEDGVRFLLVSGKPLEQPVAWYGPIVMNTQAELREAFDELERGTFLKS